MQPAVKVPIQALPATTTTGMTTQYQAAAELSVVKREPQTLHQSQSQGLRQGTSPPTLHPSKTATSTAAGNNTQWGPYATAAVSVPSYDALNSADMRLSGASSVSSQYSNFTHATAGQGQQQQSYQGAQIYQHGTQQGQTTSASFASLLSVPASSVHSRSMQALQSTTTFDSISPCTTPVRSPSADAFGVHAGGSAHARFLGSSARSDSGASAMSEQYSNLSQLEQSVLISAIQHAAASTGTAPLDSPAASTMQQPELGAIITTPSTSRAALNIEANTNNNTSPSPSGAFRHSRRWSADSTYTTMATPYHRRVSGMSLEALAVGPCTTLGAPTSPANPCLLSPVINHELTETEETALRRFISSPSVGQQQQAQTQQHAPTCPQHHQHYHQQDRYTFPGRQQQQQQRRQSLRTQHEYAAATATTAMGVSSGSVAGSLAAPQQTLARAGSWDPSMTRTLLGSSPMLEATPTSFAAAFAQAQPTIMGSPPPLGSASSFHMSSPPRRSSASTNTNAFLASTASMDSVVGHRLSVGSAGSYHQQQPHQFVFIPADCPAMETDNMGLDRAANDGSNSSTAYVEAILQTLHVTGGGTGSAAAASGVGQFQPSPTAPSQAHNMMGVGEYHYHQQQPHHHHHNQGDFVDTSQQQQQQGQVFSLSSSLLREM